MGANDSQRANDASTADPLAVWLQTVRAYEGARRLLERRLATSELSLAQLDLLAALARVGRCTQQALADHLLLSKAGTATLVARAERRGLVSRAADPADARAKLVVLTPEGRRSLDAGLQHQAEVVELTVAQLDEDSRQRLGGVMQAIEAAVARADRARSAGTSGGVPGVAAGGDVQRRSADPPSVR